MTISALITTARSWLNEGSDVYDDAIITSWVRLAEEYISLRLRCKHMIEISTASISENRVLLPSDWVALDFVRVVDGSPLLFRSRNDFYNNVNDDENYNSGYYTLSGNNMMVGDLDDGVNVELHYYQNIPALTDTDNWLYTYYQTAYIFGTLALGSMYSFEDERAPLWKGALDDFIAGLNEEHALSKASGSLLIKKSRKGFG